MTIKSLFYSTQKYCDQCSDLIKKNPLSQEFVKKYKHFSLKICECANLIRKLQECMQKKSDTYELANRVALWNQKSVNMSYIVIHRLILINADKHSKESKEFCLEKI